MNDLTWVSTLYGTTVLLVCSRLSTIHECNSMQSIARTCCKHTFNAEEINLCLTSLYLQFQPNTRWIKWNDGRKCCGHYWCERWPEFNGKELKWTEQVLIYTIFIGIIMHVSRKNSTLARKQSIASLLWLSGETLSCGIPEIKWEEKKTNERK